MASVTQLGETAQSILAAFVNQLEVQGVTLPERRYVAPGSLVPWDGEQLVVNLQQIVQGQPGAPYAGTPQPAAATVLSAQWAVSICRPAPVIQSEPLDGLPSAEDSEEAGVEAMTDAAQLVLAAVAIHAAHTLTGPGQGFAIEGCSPLGPEGGLFANRLLFTISLS
ncbi:MAG TPA: hypothetical protein VGN13_12440 [Solirubrobacteraceae bacterium]|jgi:hypothetical protein